MILWNDRPVTDLEGLRKRVERDQVEGRRRRQRFGWVVVASLVAAGGIAFAVNEGGLLAELDRGEPTATSPLNPEKPEASRKTTVSTSGDILIHSPVWYRAADNGGGTYDFAPMFGAIEPFVRGVGLSVCQLETPLTSGEPSGYPIFATPIELADGIQEAGWDACSTASNHTLDRGPEGVAETLAALRGAGVRSTGSATRRRQAERPLVMNSGGIRIGLVAYTDFSNLGAPAEPSNLDLLPYDAPVAEKKEVVQRDVERALEAGAETVLVLIQWGTENSTTPNDSQLELARAITSIPGVAAIAGQGPHVVQPIERINGKFVVFSAGNLLSNQSAAAGLPAETQYGLIALFRFHADRKGTRVERVDYVPVWVRPGDYLVEPVGWGLRNDPANAAALKAAWESTVSIAGRSRLIQPIPRDQ